MAPPEAEAEAEAETTVLAGGEGEGEGRKEENAISYMNKKKKKNTRTVCVMEASGELGSALVHTLLQTGYIVHAAIHSKGDIQQLRGQIDNKNLRVFHADLLDYHSILGALTGCAALFYTFEPPLDQHSVFDEHMGEIEVRAAHNVIEACAQTDTMEKVIFTSSVTAVIWTDAACNGSPSSSSSCDISDERNWSDINFCKKFKLWHALSKTLAEKTAWALAMDRGVSMVSVNGGLLLDNNNNNLFTAAATTTTTSIHNKSIIHPNNLPPYLKGAAEMYENGVLVAVDLRFLVDAHICVFEDVSSYGRYLCFNHVINCHEDVAKLATMLMSSHPPPPPTQSLEDTRIYPQRISNKKLNKVMVNFDGQFQLD